MLPPYWSALLRSSSISAFSRAQCVGKTVSGSVVRSGVLIARIVRDRYGNESVMDEMGNDRLRGGRGWPGCQP